jgi:hypothetical protein
MTNKHKENREVLEMVGFCYLQVERRRKDEMNERNNYLLHQYMASSVFLLL